MSKMIATMVAIAPLLGACVSAVEDSTSFGFNGAPASPEPGVDAATVADGAPDEGTGAPTDPQGSAAPSSDETTAIAAGTTDSATIATAPAGEASASVAADGTDSGQAGHAAVGPGILASGRTAIAAYAGATVSPSSETTASTSVVDSPAAANPKADATLFASLFAESQTKTPVRNADSGKSGRVILKREGAPVPEFGSPGGGTEALASLPGVKSRDSLFEIGQKASADYDAEILEEASGDEGSYQVASLSGFARLAPNGLMVQRPDVQTTCFEPKLVSMLRAVEAKFRTKIVVTSGYRSPTHNKRVNGARKSMHMACKAADIQVPGADKLQVAAFVRSLPGRGGVGTYCHTAAIHIDIGRERDWNWACRRRRG